MKKTADTIIAAAHADAAARYPGDTDAQARDRLAFTCGVLQGELRIACADLAFFNETPADGIECNLGGLRVYALAEQDEGSTAITSVLLNGSDVLPHLSESTQAELQEQVEAHFEAEGQKAAEEARVEHEYAKACDERAELRGSGLYRRAA